VKCTKLEKRHASSHCKLTLHIVDIFHFMLHISICLKKKSVNVSKLGNSHLYVMPAHNKWLEPTGSYVNPQCSSAVSKFQISQQLQFITTVATAHPSGAKRKHTTPPTHTFFFGKFYLVSLIFLPFTFPPQGNMKSLREKTNPQSTPLVHRSVDTWSSVTRDAKEWRKMQPQ
jgi:hypothetical protein